MLPQIQNINLALDKVLNVLMYGLHRFDEIWYFEEQVQLA